MGAVFSGSTPFFLIKYKEIDMEDRLLEATLPDGRIVGVKYTHLECYETHFLVYHGDLFKASFDVKTTIIDVTVARLKKKVLPEVDKSKIEKFTKK